MTISNRTLDNPIDIPAILRTGLAADPDDAALFTVDRTWTWRELDDTSARVAKHLLALGLQPGDRVASLIPNRASLLIHYLACFKAGLVATPLNYRYLRPSIEHALEVSQAAALFIHGERLTELADSSLARNLRAGWITYQADEASPHPRFEDLAADAPPNVPLPTIRPEDPSVIFFTSGSTGSPKGVTHNYRSLGWMFASAAAGMEMVPSDIVLPGSSLSHLGSFLFSLSGLAIGSRVVVARTFDGEELLPLLRTHRPTVLCMLPAALIMLVRDHGATREDFASLRLVRAGGDKVPAELEKEFHDLTGHVIDEGYGMSEVGLSCLNPPSGMIKAGSIGVPVPGFKFSIRAPDGKTEVETGEEGVLHMRTRSLMCGYWNQPDASAEVIRDGWINSGDLMRVDADGYHWFRGRKKQIIVHDGSNICPQEVESALGEHPAVQYAGAIGVHDLIHGENVRAYVTFQEGVSIPSGPELIRFARERIGYKAPEEIVVLETMPFTSSGKVDRTTLKRWAEERAHGR
jgi:long-chain acyl-CoA synthetase